MSKKVKRPQAPKQRNWLAQQVRDPGGPFREKSIKSANEYKRRPKHVKKGFTDES
jgi:hypothetical protein